PRGERRQLEERGPRIEEPLDPLAREELAARGVLRARLLGAARGDARARLAQARDERLHVGGVGGKLRIGRADPGREAAHQKSERRRASPAASMVAISAFTCSTFSAITSSSSCGLPSKRIGSPKKTRYFTGSGRRPSSPSQGQ